MTCLLAGLAEEAGDCDPGDGWYPDTGELEDLLDEVEDLAGQAPDAARELAGYVAARIREVLAAGNCLTGDLDDALARAGELHGEALCSTVMQPCYAAVLGSPVTRPGAAA